MSEKLIGHCAVDSGQLMLTDPCYLGDFETHGPDLNLEEGTDEKLYPYSYEGACNASMSVNNGGALAHPLGHEGAGVCVSSGYGDGVYPVYAEYNEDGRVSSIRVDFE